MITTKPGSKHARQMVRATAAATCMMVFVLCACGRKEAPPAAEPHRPRMEPKRAVERIENKEIEPLAVPEPGGLRPVRVTVLEYGSPAGEADVWIEHFSPTSSWWHARTRADGRATLFVPIKYTWFRVSASKVPNAIAAQFMRNLPPRAEPLDVTLNMTNQGVVITALLEAARPAMLSNVTVRIRPSDEPDWEDVSIARVPQTSGPRVVLPPVRRGLRGLRVEVTGPHIPASYSDYFDTLDGRDKTISVRVLEGVRVYGTARLANGSPAGTFTLLGTPAGMRGLGKRAGTVRETITTDAGGAFSCAKFIADFYRMELYCDNMHTIRTNVLVGEDDTQCDVVFSPKETLLVRGRVLVERTQQPVPGAFVQLSYWRAYAATTDVAGAFAMQVPREADVNGNVRVHHDGYADAAYNLYSDYQGEEIVVLLKDTAMITGTVKYDDGTPATGVSVHVSALPQEEQEQNRSRAVFGSGREKYCSSSEYGYTSPRGSDASGRYVISNVAAPARYTVYAYSDTCRLVQPKHKAPRVEVTPGGVGQCDLVVQRLPQIFIKVCNEHGAVQRSYELSGTLDVDDEESPQARSTVHTFVRTQDSDWYALDTWAVRTAPFVLSLRAVTRNGAVAETNKVHITTSGRYYVELRAVSAPRRSICGYLYTDNHEPLADVQVTAQYPGEWRSWTEETDPVGFFDLPGSSAPTSCVVELHLWHQERHYSTDVWEGTEPIVWTVPTARTVSGRVCFAHPGQPVTNFSVGFRLYDWKRVSDPGGRFTLFVHEPAATAGVVYARTADYAPAAKTYLLMPGENTDIGDIVVLPLSGTVRGRVINERGEPVRARVCLHVDDEFFPMLSAETTVDNAHYEFAGLPSGTYHVAFHNSRFTQTLRSEPFTLAPGGEYTVPDLVISLTNTLRVRLVFVKADGTPAAQMRVSHTSRPTDAFGAVEEDVNIGLHKNWELYGNSLTYYAEPFEITPASRDVRVSLAPLERMKGTVTLNDDPLESVYILVEGMGRPRLYTVYVHNGRFSHMMEPGAYKVTCSDLELVTTATLQAGANNHITFATGDAVLTVTAPAGGRWCGGLARHMEGRVFTTAERRAHGSAAMTFERLLPGTYTVSVSGELNGSWTNMACEVQLSSGQRATVAF